MPLPGLVDYDTLLIAPALVVRGGAVRPVADELLAAANDPDQLVDIDPTVVPVRAADPLSLDDDPASLGAAVAILRDAVAQALPAEFGLARDALGKTLAEQGDVAELDALAHALLREPPNLTRAEQLGNIVSIATIYGYGQDAAGWLHDALVEDLNGPPRPH